MIHSAPREQEWIDALLREASRDLVFLWHITSGRFGGPRYDNEDLPSAVARISNALVASGCLPGFGDPDEESWEPATTLLDADDVGAAITARWLAAPDELAFLVFAYRG